MKEIFDKYVETSLGEYKQATFKFKQFEFNYKKFFPQDKNAQLLDIGIGRGEMLTSMKNWGFNNSKGVDISKSTVRFCESIGLNCEVTDDTTKWLEAHLESFDLITLLDVLEHFKKEDTIQFLNALKNAMKKDAVLIIQTPNLQALDGLLHRYNDFTHEFGYTENSLRQVLETVGFSTVQFFGFEENVFGGFRGLKRDLFRSFIWKMVRFNRRMTGNLNPKILHPVFYAVVKK
jgi:2-polyprenyl-3-methyl-5-hydroxy-6-metoxy-1,4-benzoquinol methylase